jgi:alkylhydroperoxidase/carboxymuconolactone decarboxylase family protein YurZ
MSKDILPHVTPELAATRKRLAPDVHDAFTAFSDRVFSDGALPAKVKQLIAVAAEMRAGGAYAHSAVALAAIPELQDIHSG